MQQFLLQSISLCHNNLETLPPEILQLQNLKMLNLNWNKISQLPKEICRLSRLEVLEASNNRLKEVDLSEMNALQTLNLSSNVLQKFPRLCSGRFMKLVDLTNNQLWNLIPLTGKTDITENTNKITSSFEEIPKNSESSVLRLKRNRLTGAITFASLNHVTELDVSENGITSLEVTSLAALTSLKCSNNDIVTISIDGSTIKSLIADTNKITSIRVKNHPRKLQYIDVSKNSLTTIPPWFVSCNKLEFCDVSKNAIFNLPAYVTSGHLGQLRVLKANYNKLRSLSSSQALPENSLSMFERSRTCSIEVLSIHHNMIENLPDTFFYNFTRLRILNISSNLLKNFPEMSPGAILDSRYSEEIESKDDIAAHDVTSPSLQEIYASSNRLETLGPLKICQSLRIVHAPFNRIMELSDSLCRSCELLEELVLSGNKLSKLPSAISRLRRLRVLRVHLNPIKTLPKLSHLANLKVIDASHCRLGELDFESIVGESLTSLDIAFNPSLAVDRHQFSKCRSERSVRVVDTAGEKDRSFPFQEQKCSQSFQESKPTQHFRGMSKEPSASSSEKLKTQKEENNAMKTKWKIGFCESIGQGKGKLTATQLRIADLGGDGRTGLVAVADGEQNLAAASRLLEQFPEVFREEKESCPDVNEALRFSVLQCLRKLLLNDGKTPEAFCCAYIDDGGKRCETFHSRSSIRSGCTLRLCSFGNITAIITSADGPPFVMSSSAQNRSHDQTPTCCKLSGGCDIDKLSHLPDPQTTFMRLNHYNQSLVIASAGLWEHIDLDEVNRICQGITDPTLAAKRLLTLALSYGASGSLSILNVYIPWGSIRNSYQYSSLCERIATPEHSDTVQKSLVVQKNSGEQNKPKKVFKLKEEPKRVSKTKEGSKGAPKSLKYLGDMDRHPPSGQSDSEETPLETETRGVKKKFKSSQYSPSKRESEFKKLVSDCHFTNFEFDGPQNQEITDLWEQKTPNHSSQELLTPPAGFEDSDTESLGSDSGFSGNSDTKMNDGLSSQVSEEQFRSWEYVIARNTKVLRNLNSLKIKKKEGTWSSSVPDLVLEAAKEENNTSETNWNDEDFSRKQSTHLNFHRTFLRKSKIAKGAVQKLLQSKLNIGNISKKEHASDARCNTGPFKRFGSLQNLKYYQNNRPWPSADSDLNLKREEMKEASTVDGFELESRMHQYWNAGVTCF